MSAHSRVKTGSTGSKKWWDEELAAQVRRVRRADSEAYKKESKILKKMINRKKRQCWVRFLSQSGNRDPWKVVRLA